MSAKIRHFRQKIEVKKEEKDEVCVILTHENLHRKKWHFRLFFRKKGTANWLLPASKNTIC